MNTRNINKINNYDTNIINWDSNKLQKYMTILVIGYFLTKIIYGYFNKYEKKEMGNEMTEFITMIVMGWLLYIFTNMDKRHTFGHLTNINWIFFLGYIIGINIPYIYSSLSNEKNIKNNTYLQYLFYSIFIFIVIIMTYLSIRSSKDSDNVLYYIMYLIIIAIIILGLVITKQNSKFYSITIDKKNQKDKIKHGYEKTAGTYINFTIPLMGWLLSLLFMYDAEEDIIFKMLSLVNGITLGMFVGGVAYEGFPYILKKGKSEYCEGENECSKKNMIMKDKEYKNIISSLSAMRWILALVIIILIISIILFYIAK